MAQAPDGQSEHVRDDRSDSLNAILQHSKKSLISALLELQHHATSELRVFGWTKELVCLRVVNDIYTTHECQSHRLLRSTMVPLSRFSTSYAAVSYCWEPPGDKSQAPQAHHIDDDRYVEPRPARVRYQVLDRAVRFVQHHHLDGFWIDEECLDESNTVKHLQMINGMDLVYRRSRINLGLLDVGIYCQQDLNLLDLFLQGKFVETNEARALVQVRPNTSSRCLRQLLPLLYRSWPIAGGRGVGSIKRTIAPEE